MSEWRIPLSDLSYGVEEEEAVLRVVRSRWLSMGPEVQAFEQEFAGLLGVRHAVAVSSGTAALHLAYLALGLHAGDEIIQPAINFVAAANMALAIGAVPVFADIAGLTEPTIDPAEIERLIGPLTRAVVVMHYGGYFCRMAEIKTLCDRHGLFLIEDACHAVGAAYRDSQLRSPHGKMAGTLGDIACFSFFSNKNLAVGEGGMVVTDRDDLAERLRRLRSHGMTTLTWDRHRGHAASYDVLLHGYNYRLDELRAALGRVQLAKLTDGNARRRLLAAEYRRQLESIPGVQVVFPGQEANSACHLEVMLAPEARLRDAIRARLAEEKIQTSLHYPLIPDFTAFTQTGSGKAGHWSRSHEFSQRAITLPLYPTMTTEQVGQVCDAVRRAIG